jgi:hypothetical protein
MSYILHERKKNSSLGFIRGGKLSPVFWVFREGVFFVGGFFFLLVLLRWEKNACIFLHLQHRKIGKSKRIRGRKTFFSIFFFDGQTFFLSFSFFLLFSLAGRGRKTLKI